MSSDSCWDCWDCWYYWIAAVGIALLCWWYGLCESEEDEEQRNCGQGYDQYYPTYPLDQYTNNPLKNGVRAFDNGVRDSTEMTALGLTEARRPEQGAMPTGSRVVFVKSDNKHNGKIGTISEIKTNETVVVKSDEGESFKAKRRHLQLYHDELDVQQGDFNNKHQDDRFENYGPDADPAADDVGDNGCLDDLIEAELEAGAETIGEFDADVRMADIRRGARSSMDQDEGDDGFEHFDIDGEAV